MLFVFRFYPLPPILKGQLFRPECKTYKPVKVVSPLSLKPISYEAVCKHGYKIKYREVAEE